MHVEAAVSDLFSIDGKVALVTGGSRGIGRMIAEGYLRAGARVWLSARKVDQLKATAEELAALGEVHTVAADLSTPEGCTELAAAVAAEEERLHILVNNAGASWGEPLESYPAEGFYKVLNTNVTGVFLLTQALLPLLRAAASVDDPARVINIGSIDGLNPPAYEAYAYSASKGAVHMLTRHLAKRLAAEQITVNAIAPGLFASKMTAFMFADLEANAAEVFPLQRTGRPDDMAGAAIYLASRAGAYLTGAVIPVDGGKSTIP
jgi:NAD(P)-dependent dehydrogenase (short-subunit alcohol dehydrogenase family)